MTNVGLDKQVRDLVTSFKQVLDAHECHLKSFCNHGVQVEGWLKGELLGFLEQQQADGVIAGFSREVKVENDKRKKVDLKVVFPTDKGTECIWIELKHWLIGQQQGVPYNASFYFNDPTSVGISQDTKKLAKVPEENRYILVLTTANPGDEEWQRGVAKFNEKFAPPRLETLTQPSHFPRHYSLGLLKIAE